MNWRFILVVLCILCNAFFVAAEFSLIASRTEKLEIIGGKRKSAQKCLRAKEKMSVLLSGCQLGITLSSILLGVCIEPAVTHTLERWFLHLNIDATLLKALSYFISMLSIVLMHMLLGEMVPKNIALVEPEKCSMLVINVLEKFVIITRPIIELYLKITFLILKILKVSNAGKMENSISHVQLTALIDESHEAGLMDSTEFARLRQTMELQKKNAGDIAISLDNMAVIEGTTYADGTFGPSIEVVRKYVEQYGFSRYPVIDEQRSLRGYIHIKDILPQLSAGHTSHNSTPLVAPLRSLLTFPTYTSIEQVVSVLRKQNSSMGQIMSSHKNIVGIVSLDEIAKLFVDSARDELK